jgi:phage-related minor tail protein
MAKEGGFTSEQFKLINKAAIDLERIGGPKIEDTIKRLSKFKDDPVKALRELSAETGKVDEVVIKTVESFKKNGDSVSASTIAVKEFARVNKEVVKDFEEQAGSWTKLGLIIGKVFEPIGDALYNLVRARDKTEELATAVSYLQKMEKKQEDGGWVSESGLKNQREKVRWLQSQISAQKASAYWEAESGRRSKTQLAIEDDLKNAAKDNNEQLAKTLSLTDYIAKRRESLGVDKKKFATPEQFKQYDELYKKEWETHNKSKELKENSLSVLEKKRPATTA